MVKLTSLKEIYKIIQKSENPLIFFDDDPDGLCSYLQIKKHFKKGYPVVVKSSPKLDISYLKKIDEYSPDLVIVLDKPILPQDFIDKVNVPIVYIDHHPVNDIKGVKYFNPLIIDKNDDRPVSYWCYELTKDNLWIGTVGTAADYSLATIKEFNKKFPKLTNSSEDIQKIIFDTNLGKIIRIFFFVLKDPHYKVLQYVNLIEKINSPEEILEESSENAREIMSVYRRIDREYQKLLEKAKEPQKSKVHKFLYISGKMSFTSELASELQNKFKDKIILVGRQKDGLVKMSLRYQNGDLRKILEMALENLDGYGGGHKHACGANLNSKDFDEFVERLESYIK
jgi:single-stranded DNA-specific DHH superfamily exonuclease